MPRAPLRLRHLAAAGLWLTVLPFACSEPDLGLTHGKSAEAYCSNGERDRQETDVDCGGDSCRPCALGKACVGSSDCAEGTCVNNVCQAEHCSNDATDGDETDLNCGGNECAPCRSELKCLSNSDCASNQCTKNVCKDPDCRDGLLNGEETGKDCGGSSCSPCLDGTACKLPRDCQSGVCTPGTLVCAAPACNDRIKNGTETAADCGGDCSPCSTGKACILDEDCTTKFCDPQTNLCTATQCDDNFQNGNETDTDCGGGCPPCADFDTCKADKDCQSNSCDGTACQPASCTDGKKNPGEGGVDCGGTSTCGLCDDGDGCTVGTDCTNGVCSGSPLTCQAPTCGDGAQNQGETDVDCGGANCPATCQRGDTCASPGDCESGICDASGASPVCAAPACGDGYVNGSETGVDCGGDVSWCAARCPDGQGCLVAADCQSGICDAGSHLCAQPSVRVYLRTQDPGIQDFKVFVKVENLTAASITGDQVMVRYYYSREQSQDSYLLDQSNVVTSGTYSTFTLGLDETDVGNAFVSFTLPSNMSIAKNATSVEVSFRVHNGGPSPGYDKSNDYSWLAPAATSVAQPKMAAWLDGTLVFGLPPQ